jgi:hypothetical protein
MKDSQSGDVVIPVTTQNAAYADECAFVLQISAICDQEKWGDKRSFPDLESVLRYSYGRHSPDDGAERECKK